MSPLWSSSDQMPPFLPLMVLGVGLLGLGFSPGAWAPLVAWLGLDFLLLSGGHLAGTPALLGKRACGTLAIWSWIVFLPLHLYTLGIWHLYRILNREAPTGEVSATLVIGRRLLASEVRGDFANYLDLTAEFNEPAHCRGLPGYQALPILDASVPRADQLDGLFSRLRPGRTFIHCAQGHGRTGLVAAAFLIFSGEAPSAACALRRLQAVRPRLRLNRGQQAFLDAYARHRAA